MKILYIHGFNSSPISAKVKMLNLQFTDAEIIAPSHSSRAKDVYELIDPIVKKLYPSEAIIVGTSLGGFWANYFACKYRIPSVIINPAITPATTLQKYIGDYVNSDSHKKYKWSDSNCQEYKQYQEETTALNDVQRIVLLAKDDDVISIGPAIDKYSNVAEVKIFESGGHIFSDVSSLNEIQKAIKKLYYTIII